MSFLNHGDRFGNSRPFLSRNDRFQDSHATGEGSYCNDSGLSFTTTEGSGRTLDLHGTKPSGPRYALSQFKKLFELLDLTSRDEQQYFVLSLMQEKTPKFSDNYPAFQQRLDKLGGKVTFTNKSLINQLVKFFIEKLEGEDLRLEEFYKDFLEMAEVSMNRALCEKFTGLIEAQERAQEAQAFKKRPEQVSCQRDAEIEREVENLNQYTKLSPKLILVLMGLDTFDEKKLFALRRTELKHQKLQTLAGGEYQPSNHTKALYAQLGQDMANYINNLANIANAVDEDKNPVLGKYAQKLMNVAIRYGKKKEASEFFDRVLTAIPDFKFKKPEDK